MQPVATVVITYFQPRLPLLDRCLYLLRESTVPLEIILVNDGDEMPADPRLDLVFRCRERGIGKAPNIPFRAGFARATTDYVIHCPPEMLVPRDGVERMLTGHQPGHRDVPALFALSQGTTEHLDDWPWREDLSCFQQDPDLMLTWGPLAMRNIDAQFCNWHLNFSGATRDEWLRFGVLPETSEAGMNENWLADQEEKAGTRPILSPVTVYHQWHPSGSWWMAGVGHRVPDTAEPTTPAVPESVRVARAKGYDT